MTAPVLPVGQQSRSLAEQTQARTDAPTDLRMGTVTAVTAFGISVNVGGAVITASHLDSYAPAVGHTVVCQRVLDSWVCLGRPVGSGTAQGGGTAGSGMGVSTLGGVTLTGAGTLASSTGSEVSIPGMTMTFFHPTGHTLLLLAGVAWNSGNSTDWIITRLRTNGTTQVGEFPEPIVNSGFGRYLTMQTVVPATFGGVDRTYYMTMARLTGSGTTNVTRSATNPSYLVAIDLGDKSLVKAV